MITSLDAINLFTILSRFVYNVVSYIYLVKLFLMVVVCFLFIIYNKFKYWCMTLFFSMYGALMTLLNPSFPLLSLSRDTS